MTQVMFKPTSKIAGNTGVLQFHNIFLNFWFCLQLPSLSFAYICSLPLPFCCRGSKLSHLFRIKGRNRGGRNKRENNSSCSGSPFPLELVEPQERDHPSTLPQHFTINQINSALAIKYFSISFQF